MGNPHELLLGVRDQTSTHDCPKCQGPAYCAMTAGKSASACWCMSEPIKSIPEDEVELECLCKRCLTASEGG